MLIGDSTVAPGTGWGEAFREREVNTAVLVRNRARGGESSKSFYESATSPWSVGANAVLGELRANDFLVIQFGHNDEKTAPDLHTEPGTAPDYDGSYRDYLLRYVDEARAIGATPVLVTPVSRMVFESSGALRRTHGDYPAAMRRLARDEALTLLDLEQRSFETFSQLGKSQTLANYSSDGDLSHFPADKAWRVAQMVAVLVRDSDSDLVCVLRARP